MLAAVFAFAVIHRINCRACGIILHGFRARKRNVCPMLRGHALFAVAVNQSNVNSKSHVVSVFHVIQRFSGQDSVATLVLASRDPSSQHAHKPQR